MVLAEGVLKEAFYMEKAYAMYLRKSRKDAAEASIEETLARHEARLRQLAQERGLAIGAVYREVVSGLSLIHI